MTKQPRHDGTNALYIITRWLRIQLLFRARVFVVISANLRRCAIFFCATLLLIAPQQAQAFSLIRDAEIENTLRAYGTPVWESAGLEPKAIRLFIINDPSINAFVAGGQNIFIHTGLILATQSADMMIGVIAHETGHIAGGHLAIGAEKIQNAQLGSILTYVLGAAAAVASGGKGGPAVLAASQQAITRNFLSFTRANEQAADQAALGFLDDNAISANGMLKMFEILKREEDRHFGTVSPYLRTHPLSKERIIHIRNHLDTSTIPRDAAPQRLVPLQARMIAKLFGFIKTPEQTLARYPLSNNSVEARYARAIAWYKIPEVAKSLGEMDSLLKEYPNDPYFHEMKGQILFENGRATEAMKSYGKAVALLPDASLIRVEYAKTQLAVGGEKLIADAVHNLERATSEDTSNADGWRNLAIGYGKQNKLGMAYVAQAELALLNDDASQVTLYVTKALAALPDSSPARLRAMDLKILAEKQKKDKK